MKVRAACPVHSAANSRLTARDPPSAAPRPSCPSSRLGRPQNPPPSVAPRHPPPSVGLPSHRTRHRSDDRPLAARVAPRLLFSSAVRPRLLASPRISSAPDPAAARELPSLGRRGKAHHRRRPPVLALTLSPLLFARLRNAPASPDAHAAQAPRRMCVPLAPGRVLLVRALPSRLPRWPAGGCCCSVGRASLFAPAPLLIFPIAPSPAVAPLPRSLQQGHDVGLGLCVSCLLPAACWLIGRLPLFARSRSQSLHQIEVRLSRVASCCPSSPLTPPRASIPCFTRPSSRPASPTLFSPSTTGPRSWSPCSRRLRPSSASRSRSRSRASPSAPVRLPPLRRLVDRRAAGACTRAPGGRRWPDGAQDSRGQGLTFPRRPTCGRRRRPPRSRPPRPRPRGPQEGRLAVLRPQLGRHLLVPVRGVPVRRVASLALSLALSFIPGATRSPGAGRLRSPATSTWPTAARAPSW